MRLPFNTPDLWEQSHSNNTRFQATASLARSHVFASSCIMQVLTHLPASLRLNLGVGQQSHAVSVTPISIGIESSIRLSLFFQEDG